MDREISEDEAQNLATHEVDVSESPVQGLLVDDPALHTVCATAPAQLLEYAHARYVALPQHTTLEVLEQPQIVPVPGSAYYSVGLAKWQNRWLPVIDLHVLLQAYRKQYAAPTRYLLVVAYQTGPRAPVQHGVIALPMLPVVVTVSDDTLCPLPTDSDLWPHLALSCFEYQGSPVPILDTGRLFRSYHD
jgi:chemotaxis signal transduction protein